MLILFSLFAQVFCERSFKIVGNDFEMDGKKFRYVSGSFHYFRQQPEYWEDNIKKMATGGLNAVQTYVAWNLHEPRKGEYNFDGIADIEKFLDICQKYGMYVILRPGPFICAEWDFGGLPSWLLAEDISILRSSDEVYLKHVDDWFNVLFKKLKKYMYHNGGNIIMVQVENEYGAYYSCDQVYLKHLCDLTRNLLGQETVLFTTDQPYHFMVKCGAIPSEALITIDFGTGTDPAEVFPLQRKWNNGAGPYVNSEYYPGWLDHWMEEHHTVSSDDVALYLDKMLALGGNVNFYMYYGGTNFFYYNGANGDRFSYQADPTSYDYDAPLSEAGDMTYKWSAVRDVIAKYMDIAVYDVQNTTKKSYGKVSFTQGVAFYDTLDTITTITKQSDAPLNFEDLGTDYGFVLYSSKLTRKGYLSLVNVRDRASIYLNKQHISTMFRSHEQMVHVDTGDLDILVENCGRINYGFDFVDRKGLPAGVKIDFIEQKDWTNRAIPLMTPDGIKFTNSLPTGQPAFYRATFNVDEPADTYFNPTGLSKGIAFINGYHIGRYWTIGPQLTLYVPAPLLKKGENELIVFEIDPIDTVPTISFDDTPQLDVYH